MSLRLGAPAVNQLDFSAHGSRGLRRVNPGRRPTAVTLSPRSGWNIPVYLVFVSLLQFVGRDFSQAQQSPIELGNLHRVTAIVLALVLLVKHSFSLSMTSVQKAYFAYIAVASISVVFSPLPLFSVWKIAEISAVFLLSVYVFHAARHSPAYAYHFYDLTLTFFKVLVGAALVGVVIFPSASLQAPMGEASIEAYGAPILPYQVSGQILQVNPNSLGVMAAVLSFVSVMRLMNGHRGVAATLWLPVSLSVLIFAQSRTALVGFGLAMAVGFLFTPRRRRWAQWCVAIAGMWVIGTWSDLLYTYVTRGVGVEGLSDLSGRVGWWAVAIDTVASASIGERFFGLGFMVSNRTILATSLDDPDASSLHSDYVDALVSTGYVGTVALVLALLYLLFLCSRAMMSTPRTSLQVEVTGVASILVVRTFTGPTIASHSIFLPMFFAVAILLHFIVLRRRLEGR